jgi:hypothetical protein
MLTDNSPNPIPLSRGPIGGETIVKAKDLRSGDYVDLQGGPNFADNPAIEFEYGVVTDIVPETPNCIAIYFEGIGGAGYHPDQEFIALRSRDR